MKMPNITLPKQLNFLTGKLAITAYVISFLLFLHWGFFTMTTEWVTVKRVGVPEVVTGTGGERQYFFEGRSREYGLTKYRIRYALWGKTAKYSEQHSMLKEDDMSCAEIQTAWWRIAVWFNLYSEWENIVDQRPGDPAICATIKR